MVQRTFTHTQECINMKIIPQSSFRLQHKNPMVGLGSIFPQASFLTLAKKLSSKAKHGGACL